ncbi:hypothetical protein PROVRETT_07258 [Providencia rettgeri DSM 1131]|nr:hypothetical protein PROVRETT_07258 [Providencia rettgeri DSM 1131]
MFIINLIGSSIQYSLKKSRKINSIQNKANKAKFSNYYFNSCCQF